MLILSIAAITYSWGMLGQDRDPPLQVASEYREQYQSWDATGISQYRLAKEIGVSARRINEIVKGMRAITADADLRLARYFGLSDGYWLRAQMTFQFTRLHHVD